MVFKNFRINILLRLILIFGLLLLCTYFILSGNAIRAVYLTFAILLTLIEFFRYIDRTNRNLTQFFTAIQNDDFTNTYAGSDRGRSFMELYQVMNAINTRYKAASTEKETRELYLRSLIDQVRVGILSYDDQGSVRVVNPAFKRMLDLESLAEGSDMASSIPVIYDLLDRISYGKTKLLRLKVRGEEIPFSIQSSGIRMADTRYHIITLHNIQSEITETEMDAWQKIIRVLTHEIMNSVTPITSLSGSLRDLVSNDAILQGSQTGGKLRNGLNAIVERSDGLLKFTEAYQKFSRLPAPQLQLLATDEFVNKITALYAGEMEKQGIMFEINFSGEPARFPVDPDLMEQVIINLLRNAIDAVSSNSNAEIRLNISSADDHREMMISVSDNGTGINDEDLDKVFIPFYTTKQRGSGIGLPLSRQIVLMHKGSIEVTSEPGKGSCFTVLLPLG